MHHHRSAGVAACAPEVEGSGKDVLCSPMQLRSAAEGDLDAASTAAVALGQAQVATPKLRWKQLAEAPPPAVTSSPAVVPLVAGRVPLHDGQGDFAILGSLVMGFWNSCASCWEWTSQKRTNSFHSYSSCKGCSCGWGCAPPCRDFQHGHVVWAQVAPEEALPQVPSVHLGESPCDPPARWDQ